MKYSVLTSFNEKYFNEVAKNNILELDKNWNRSGTIFLYHELKQLPTDLNLSNRVEWIDLYDSSPGLSTFVEKWKDHPNANGQKNFRTNAVKFVHKTFAIWNCWKNTDSDWLVWLDCDAMFYKQMDDQFIKNVFDEQFLCAYLGRPGKYSECGFLAFNLKKSETKQFLEEWENLYTSGNFINLPETHDSWTFDYIRKKWDRDDLFLNLNSKAVTNKNPFGQSVIGPYVMHAKGDDKKYQIDRFKNRHMEKL